MNVPVFLLDPEDGRMIRVDEGAPRYTRYTDYQALEKRFAELEKVISARIEELSASEYKMQQKLTAIRKMCGVNYDAPFSTMHILEILNRE